MDISRRRYIQGAAVASVAAISGCSSSDIEKKGDQLAEDIASPKVTSEYVTNWTKTGSDTKTFSDTGVSGAAKTIMYENTALRNEIKKKTLGSFDQTLAMTFATHIDLEGLITGLASPDEIADKIEPELKNRMNSAGIQNVRSVPVATPMPEYPSHNSTVREYEGEFTVPPFKQTAEINGEDRTVKLESKRLPITGLLSVWKTKSGVAFAGGGAFPKESYNEFDRISITGKEEDGIDVGIFVNLDFEPLQLRREVIDIAENIEKE